MNRLSIAFVSAALLLGLADPLRRARSDNRGRRRGRAANLNGQGLARPCAPES